MIEDRDEKLVGVQEKGGREGGREEVMGEGDFEW